MALHRDIFWIGRQWTVTGLGIQACDQKNYGTFDIEAGRLWDPDALDKVRDQGWLNIVDFEKALGIARQRYPEPPKVARPSAVESSVLGLIDNVLREPLRKRTLSKEPGTGAMNIEPRRPITMADFVIRLGRWPAKFVPPWRIRISR